MPDRLEYVVFQGGELARRHDVEVASKGFTTSAAAEATIRQLGGTIPESSTYVSQLFRGRFRKRFGAGTMSALWARPKYLSLNKRHWKLGVAIEF
jgi:hypothetical protein